MLHYTGIGSRSTPEPYLSRMTILATELAKKLIVLRSGGASGADMAFERGAGALKEIYLPWKNFNGNLSHLHHISDAAMDMAKQFHPAWHRLSDPVRKLMVRNSYQVLGYDLQTPSDFVVCWTENGQLTGGTSQALRIAVHHEIPIINFGSKEYKNAPLKYILDKIDSIIEEE